jgi:putative addiction module component (TIGR02574 family)
MKAISEFAKEAMELPPAQRLTLARMLIDSSEDDRDFSPEAQAAWDAEISRRMEAVKAGAAQSRGFDEVFADLDRRFPS